MPTPVNQHYREHPPVFLDEVIELDSPAARLLGFTSDKFDGYLWIRGHEIWISAVWSLDPGKGHLRALVEAILSRGYVCKVPTPLADMRAILEKWQFDHVPELGPIQQDYVDVWSKSGKLPRPSH